MENVETGASVPQTAENIIKGKLKVLQIKRAEILNNMTSYTQMSMKKVGLLAVNADIKRLEKLLAPLTQIEADLKKWLEDEAISEQAAVDTASGTGAGNKKAAPSIQPEI